MNRVSNSYVRIGLSLAFLSLGTSIYAETLDRKIDSRTAKIDNVELHYLTAGSGPTVILLHGYAETSRTWRPIIPLLAEKLTVNAQDLPTIADSSIRADNSESRRER